MHRQQDVPDDVSRGIRSFGYDDGERTLAVELRDGRVFHFFRVDVSIFIGLKRAVDHMTHSARSFDGFFYERVAARHNCKRIT